MTKLADLGHSIIYVEPPKGLFKQFVKLFLKREQKPRQWFKRILRIKARTKNLYIFSQLKLFGLKSSFFRRLNSTVNSVFFNFQLNRLKFKSPILWIYDPVEVFLADKINSKFIIYDCLDDYSSQPYYIKNFTGVLKDEKRLLEKADCVFTCSPHLKEQKKMINPNTHFIANAADFAHFSKALDDIPVPGDICSLPKPVIGFIGALDTYKLNFELLRFISERKRNWSVVLIGGVGEAEKKRKLDFLEDENVYFLGKKPYEVLPNYLKAIDVAIIPYRTNNYTRCFYAPLKLFEYFSAGKPVVACGIPAVNDFHQIMKYTFDFHAFETAVAGYIETDNEYDKMTRIEIAGNNTWTKKAERQLEIIKQNK
jgi:glycosyltransferase involved in cell wall biosynthesis